MSVSSPFIHRPIATSLLGIAVMLGGALGYWWLPVSALPQVDFPTIQVTTQLPGASPDTIASLVTAPLERQFGQIPALQVMTSSSSFGISQVTLQFDLNRDIDAAAQDVQSAINAAGSTLPRNLPYPPLYSKVNPADAPIITLALTSQTIDLRTLSDMADTIMAPRLSEVTGVGHVSVQGGIRPAIRIQADLSRLAAYGIALEDLRTAIVSANVAGAKGSLDGAHQSYTIAANDQITAAATYKSVVVAFRNGAPVKISDVADVIDGLENTKVGATYKGTPAIVVDVQRQPGANVIETVERVRAELPRLRRAMPAGARLTIVNDRTTTIRASIHDVQFTLMLSVVLVVLVVLIFLRTVRATIIAGVALPLSLIATFGVMWFAGFSLDNLSLMALTIGTGFVVDDAIVMIENIVRHMEDGEKPLDAALRGASEIGFTVISLTLSLIAVFIPLLFMTGLVGRMFREFALTLTIAVVASAIVSLTLTPMMCSRLLRQSGGSIGGGGDNALSRRFSGLIDRTVEAYHRSLVWVLRRQRETLIVTLATLAATVFLYIVMPKGFLPLQDTGLITAVTEAGTDVSFDEMQRRQSRGRDHHPRRSGRDRRRLGDRRLPAQRHAQCRPARHHLEAARCAQFARRRDHRAAEGRGRRHSRHECVFPGHAGHPDLHAGEPRAVPIHAGRQRCRRGAGMGRQTDAQAARRSGAERGRLRSAGRRPARERRRRPRAGRTARRLDAEHHRHAQRRLRPAADFDHLRPGQPVSRHPGGAAALPTGPRLARQALRHRRQHLDRNGGDRRQYRDRQHQHQHHGHAQHGDRLEPGAARRLRALREHLGAAVDRAPGAVPLGHHQLRSERPATRSPTRSRVIGAAQQQIGMPSSVTGSYSGDAAEFAKSLTGEPWLILAAAIVIYIVLGVLYESFIHPLTILSTLPSAGVGALLALMLFGYDLSVIALIGIVLLMGIVKKNAILMIDFAIEAERHQGLSPEESIVQAALLRFRPIMMTTLAALFGALPLALESGTGSELRNPLGITIVGGLLLSQLLTLYTTPVIYLYMERLRARLTAPADARPHPAE